MDSLLPIQTSGSPFTINNSDPLSATGRKFPNLQYIDKKFELASEGRKPLLTSHASSNLINVTIPEGETASFLFDVYRPIEQIQGNFRNGSRAYRQLAKILALVRRYVDLSDGSEKKILKSKIASMIADWNTQLLERTLTENVNRLRIKISRQVDSSWSAERAESDYDWKNDNKEITHPPTKALLEEYSRQVV